jgi:hypothetical protein
VAGGAEGSLRERQDSVAKFTPGTPKPPNSGRKPGSKNKRTEALEALKGKVRLDPLDFFRAVLEADLAVLGGDAPTLDQRVTAAKELAGYLYPKLKAVEVTGDVGELKIKLKWPEEGVDDSPDPNP